jgi:hypothetical protein
VLPQREPSVLALPLLQLQAILSRASWLVLPGLVSGLPWVDWADWVPVLMLPPKPLLMLLLRVQLKRRPMLE